MVAATTVALHLFNPTDWPPLAVDILHSLHGPGFAAIALAVFLYLQVWRSSAINYLLAAGITMGIGLISEIAQIPGPRDAQLKDLVVDTIGIMGVLGITASYDKRLRRQMGKPTRRLLHAVAGIALAIACVPTLWYSYALVQQKRAFPVLLTFEYLWERAAFGQANGHRPELVDAPAGWPSEGKLIAHAAEAGRWGIFLSLHPLPDWQGYTMLSFVVASADAEFPMALCIRDARSEKNSRGNRFCKRLYVDATPHRFEIEFEEIQSKMEDTPFDFSRVEAVVFSAAKPGNGMELLVDDIRLEL